MNNADIRIGKDRAVLVRAVNWIGDAVMTIPALRAFRRSVPGSELSMLVKPWVAPIFAKDPDIHEILPYSEAYRGFRGRFALANELKERSFCMSILFQNAFDAALISFLARIPRRIGYSRDGRGWLLTDPVPFDAKAKAMHHIDYYLNLVRKAGFNAPPDIPWLFIELQERLAARSLMKHLSRPVVGINPGATYGSSKRWHPERFAEVARRVIEQLGGSVVLLGGPSERAIADEIVSNMDNAIMTGSTFLDLAGNTTLRQLMAVISECDMLVTNDSGPMHIGYAVGTPVTAIFGSTSPEATGPVGSADIVIRHKTECSPCFRRECRKKSLECMDLITADEVYESVVKLTRKKRAVFFDRDGTLCRDAHFLNRMADLEIFPAIDSLPRLKEGNFSLIGISNQSGIARGLVDEEFTKSVNRIFMEQYGFEGFYYCPHHPDDHCSCRKPQPGMLIRAGNEHSIDLRQSFYVGDKEDDMILAKAAGMKGILVRTGKAQSSEYADAIADDLNAVTGFILDNA